MSISNLAANEVYHLLFEQETPLINHFRTCFISSTPKLTIDLILKVGAKNLYCDEMLWREKAKYFKIEVSFNKYVDEDKNEGKNKFNLTKFNHAFNLAWREMGYIYGPGTYQITGECQLSNLKAGDIMSLAQDKDYNGIFETIPNTEWMISGDCSRQIVHPFNNIFVHKYGLSRIIFQLERKDSLQFEQLPAHFYITKLQ